MQSSLIIFIHHYHPLAAPDFPYPNSLQLQVLLSVTNLDNMVCWDTHWSMGNLPETTSSKESDSPSSKSINFQ